MKHSRALQDLTTSRCSERDRGVVLREPLTHGPQVTGHNVGMATADAPLPESLAARPWDERRKVPVPLMNMRPVDIEGNPGAVPGDEGVEWVADFTAIYAPTVYKCGRDRLCGLCGADLGYWVGFLGGPKSHANRAYIDPPAHVECLEAALRLCPHIAAPNHQRAPDHRMSSTVSAPAGFDAARADEWVMGITRDYKMEATSQSLIFRPLPFKRTRRFGYVNGTLEEIG